MPDASASFCALGLWWLTSTLAMPGHHSIPTKLQAATVSALSLGAFFACCACCSRPRNGRTSRSYDQYAPEVAVAVPDAAGDEAATQSVSGYRPVRGGPAAGGGA